MAVALTPALSQREREIKERAARDFHGKERAARDFHGKPAQQQRAASAARLREELPAQPSCSRLRRSLIAALARDT